MWKLRITFKKKKRKNVEQYKFETPSVPQIDEPAPVTIQIEAFKNIEKDPILYDLLKQWAVQNNINSRQTYQNYLDSSPTVTLNGRTFALPKLDALAKSYKFYRDAIQPETQNKLTKEILFQILDSYFKNNDIPLTYDSYAKFIKQNRVPIVVIDEDGQRKNATGILFNGQIYPVPSEIRTDKQTGNRKFDTQAMSWVREYRRIQQNIQGTTDENTKNLWDADQNTLTKIIKQIIQDMLKAKLNIKLSNYNLYINNFLPKIEHMVNGRFFYVPFIDFEGQRYLLYQLNDRVSKLFEDNAFNTTWKNEALEHYNKTIGAEQYLRRNLPTFSEKFPQYTFRTEVPIAEIDSNFIPWINKFQTQGIKKKFNRDVLYNFLKTESQGEGFKLSTIKDTDSFQIIPQEDGKYTVRVTRKLKTKTVTRDVKDQVFGNVQPGKFALDLVVFENNNPIAIYEYDGEFHYGEGQFGQIDLMSDLINDQIQKYYIQNRTNIPYFRVPYFSVSGGTEKFPDFVIKHLKSLNPNLDKQ